MNRASWLAIACVAAAACGGDKSGDPIDAAALDAPAIDGPPNSIDAPVDLDAPSCAKPVIFIDGDGGTYTMSGSEDSRTNHSSMITGTRSFTGPGATRAAAIANLVRTALAAQGVQVTSTDPGNTAQHVEVVLVTGTWSFANQVAVAPLNCNVIPNAVGFVNVSGAQTDADAAGAALFVIGAASGLDLSTTASNCMNTAAASCTFSATATTANDCGMATQDQPAILHTAFGCS